MQYNLTEWRKRVSERSDLSAHLIHLTRKNKAETTDMVLYQILKSRKLLGSSTSSGFIIGDEKAVCFQDIPIYSICQNILTEQNMKLKNANVKLRYQPMGLAFKKDYVFNKGGRPAIYDKTDNAKYYLPKSEWWRIVNMDFSDPNNIIDWSHEREWRVKGDFQFELKDVTILLNRLSSFQK
ncbi:MAG: DUF2971 domain-containing protein, partial [Ignavibacteria bacterium]|nr:DUF2971 domain-containing protein [Ignavibacteria bacterium]